MTFHGGEHVRFYTYGRESIESVTFAKVYTQELVCIMGKHTNLGEIITLIIFK